jgi:methionyl-tRNA formyltransferase
MGTPDYAVSSLEACLEKHDVVAVFTQPDRPKGRGKKMSPPPVKVKAEEHNIPVYQPLKLKTEENVEILKDLSPDLIVVVAYGQILSKEILDIPPKGCINVHASLLPKYRGASPINWAIVQGEKVTGVTTMYMDVGLDTGDMIEKIKVEIKPEMTAGALHDILMVKGGEVLSSTLELISTDNAPRTPQDDSLSTYAPLLDKATGIIDWAKDVQTIIDQIRGLNPWPVAVTKFEGKNMKIFSAAVGEDKIKGTPGEILQVDKTGLYVQAGNGIVSVQMLQFPNSKQMHISQYILGHEVPCGIILG